MINLNLIKEETLERVAVNWKTTAIGAIEGSGLSIAGILSGDKNMIKVSLLTAVYLLIKGLISKDAGK